MILRISGEDQLLAALEWIIAGVRNGRVPVGRIDWDLVNGLSSLRVTIDHGSEHIDLPGVPVEPETDGDDLDPTPTTQPSRGRK